VPDVPLVDPALFNAYDAVIALYAQEAVAGNPIKYEADNAYDAVSAKDADTELIAQEELSGNPSTYEAVIA
jgi:stringent starvation protein B